MSRERQGNGDPGAGAEALKAGLRRQRRFALVLVAVIAPALAGAGGWWWGARIETALRADTSETLALQTEALKSAFEKYEYLAPILSRRAEVQALLSAPETEAVRAAAQRLATEIALPSGARDLALLRPDGSVLASARGVFGQSVGAPSALMAGARQNRLGRAAIANGRSPRAYAFASGVRQDGVFIGAVAVLVRFEPIEATWVLRSEPILAVDQAGTILLSNRPAWLGRQLDEIRVEAGSTARYTAAGRETEYIEGRRSIPLLGWELRVLTAFAPVGAARSFGAAAALMGVALVGIIGFVILIRREHLVLSEQRERATAIRLEREVAERTRDLSESNAALAREVKERTRTEAQLRTMQTEIIQTGKLAALGQMSAALSHEYNQPLAATRTYAENAIALIDKDRVAEARANITNIAALAERMAAISRHLRNFARKPAPELREVALGPVIDDALSMLRSRIKEAGVRVKVATAEPDLVVTGGSVRLEQVLINLIANALDAVAGQKRPVIDLTVSASDEAVIIAVADRGQGIDPALAGQIFDPFFTTKQVGQGLGLGLSISYNIVKDFGGRLSAANRVGGGAVFTVELRRARLPQVAPA